MDQSPLSGIPEHDDGGAPARVFPDCILFEAPITARLLTACSGMFPEGYVSSRLARLSGATVAVGTASGIERLCEIYRPHYLEKMRRFAEANGLPDSAAKWLAGDDVASSSLALFYHLTGIEPPGFLDRSAHPYDLADFRRCRALVESLSDYSHHLTRMEEVSDQWAGLIERWQVICASLDRECPHWRESLSHAPDTERLLKKALAGE